MDEFEFSEDEIRKELENLGYFNVHQARLTEFKRDLQNLVDVDRSNTASNTSTNVPSSESNYDLSSSDRDGPQFRVQPILRKPLDGSENSHNVVQSTTQLQANPVGKENIVSATTSQQVITARTHPRDAIHIPSDSQTRGDITVPFNSGYRESSVLHPHQHSYPASGVPHVMTEGHNVSMDTTASTASDRSIMKRKVLRKVDGHSQIFDESSVTDTDDYTADSIEERLQNMRLHIPDTDYISQNGTRRPQTAVLGHKPEMEQRHHVNRPHSAHAAYRLPKYYDGPKALIKPMTSQPHTKNIKKTDPVSKYQQYRESWQSQRAPGEKKHKALRWHVREHMLYHDEVVKKKAHNVYVSNDYVVPSDKKRKNLRWQIRMDMAQGIIPPSQFD